MPRHQTSVPLFQVDAFAEQLFSGNPAAVCLLDEAAPEEWLQALATEMNLSETAYVRPLDDGFELRWFTPAFEVDLCGHATLASASILWSKGYVGAEEEIVFHTLSGALTVHLRGEWMVMDFPAEPAQGRMGIAGDLFVVRRQRYYRIASSSLRNLTSQAPSANVIVFLQVSTRPPAAVPRSADRSVRRPGAVRPGVCDPSLY